MVLTKPAYYDAFACLAGDCPDSCCHQWDVQVDPAAAARYQALPGALGDRLRQFLYREDGAWYLALDGDRCPLWQADGLCQIQRQLGHEALCAVCRNFPRLRHDYGDFVELGLELSCPEAARLILTAPAAPPVQAQVPGGDVPEYDREAMLLLRKTRQTALALLRDHPLPQALGLLLLYAHHVQHLLDGAAWVPFQEEAAVAFGKTLAEPPDPAGLRRVCLGLEILTDRWRHLLEAPPAPGPWLPGHRAMARYGVERYWLQAVSDYDLAGRVKLILSGCVLVRDLGGDLLSTAQLWSKEIENCADNVEALLDAAYHHPALTDARLLGALLP